MTTREQIQQLAQSARAASAALRTLSSGAKNAFLLELADVLVAQQNRIFAANALDCQDAKTRGLSEAMLARLQLTEKKVRAMSEGCRQVAALPDPIGRILSGETRPNGLRIEQVRVPLGVIAVIYESRPNVTVDAAILALKAGNSVILRGGSEAIRTNSLLARIIADTAHNQGFPRGAVGFVETTDREATQILATLGGEIDLIIPRGGEALKKALQAVATVPVIFAAGGVCHVYVDEFADLTMAEAVAFNAKTQNPSVCNAMETLLVHDKIAAQFLPLFAEKLRAAGGVLRGDERAKALVPDMESVQPEDFGTEFLDLTLAVRVVDTLEAATDHIARFGTAHSEAIITQNYARAEEFLARVDAAAVYVNASTRFSDGFELGLGAEVGISTQKLHARGPMGLEALTSTKYVVRGNGQIRE